ncbi:MAG TPA: class I SAM-dependent methyltransferase [Bacteroidia bacterium]|nr:class I SAM-dependent methyltransferase [Bacteroidia bacterium]
MSNQDKAGADYWTSFWKQTKLPEPFNFNSGKLNDYPAKLLHSLFTKIVEGKSGSDIKFLEIGCGNSVFLPYFAQNYGFSIYGLDYSEFACKQSEKILEREGTPGTITQGDAFNPPSDMIEKFDIVCSLGVVEHFEDTAGTLKAFARFVKPGGILITSIPNLVGVTGFLQKIMNKPVYDIHVPMDKNQLEQAIRKAGLELKFSEYFLAISFAVTLEGKEGAQVSNLTMKKFVLKTIRYTSKLIWVLENKLRPLPAGKLLSGGIITSAIKKNH